MISCVAIAAGIVTIIIAVKFALKNATGTVGTITTQPSAASFEWLIKKWPTEGYDGWKLHSIVYGKKCIKKDLAPQAAK